MTTRPLLNSDSRNLDALLDSVFGADRHGRTAYRIRGTNGWIPALSFARIEDDMLVGSIQCWPIVLRGWDGRASALTMVGPVAVHPDRQKQGIGRALIRMAMASADLRGDPPQLLIGDAPYYAPFGFSAARTGGWMVPGPVDPARLLLRARGADLPAIGKLGPR